MTMSERFEFTPEDDGTVPIKTAVYQALGAASMCWSETPKGIFESDRATQIGEALMAVIESTPSRSEDPS